MRKKTTKRGKWIALTAGLGVLVLGGVIGVVYRSEILAWYDFYQLFESVGRNEQRYSEYRHRQTGIVFVSLPGGRFLRGSPESDARASKDERPQHEVTLSPFLIAKYEITQAQWRRIMVNYRAGVSKFTGDQLPVERVWPGHCVEFCDKAGFSLPTEAQWEYACRAGTTTRYSSGDEESDLAKVAWYHKNSRGRPHPVGQKPANGFGLHDMHGNVFEWCIDVYDHAFYSKTQSRERDARNTKGNYRILRGGAYYEGDAGCRSAYRGEFDDPGIKGPGRGFRPVWPPNYPPP
ncbi:MAG: formylglycine-generating enzyme family protein [Planctomycetota bacterium]